MDKKILDFSTRISRLLKIKPPKIVVNPLLMRSATQLAAVDTESYTIALKSGIPSLDLFFSIAHELRHLWQKQDNTAWFEEYKTAQEIGVLGYNRQPAEIDANAFAAAIMGDFFGQKPLFNGLDEKTIEMIQARAEEIKNI